MEAIGQIDGAVVCIDAVSSRGIVHTYLVAVEQFLGKDFVVKIHGILGLSAEGGISVKGGSVVHFLAGYVPGQNSGVKDLAFQNNLIAGADIQISNFHQCCDNLAAFFQFCGGYTQTGGLGDNLNKFLVVVAGYVTSPDADVG